MMRFALDALTGFSSAPLKLASHAGLWLVARLVLLIVYIAYRLASAGSIQGWTSLMLVVVVLGAVQMFVLALMGEYIGRLYNEAKRRPLYIVQEIAGRTGGERPARLCRSTRPANERRHARRQGQAPDRIALEAKIRSKRALTGPAAACRRVLLAAQPDAARRRGEREEQAVEIADHLELQPASASISLP
jgi:hypothetical protein